MNLTSDMWIKKNVFPQTPYFRPKSKLLIDNVKRGDIDEIYRMLNNDRFLVYDFDHIKQTCLHWAAKRNRPEIIKVLLHFGAYIDAKDSGKRTPLYLAAKMGNIKWVKVLLANEADTSAKTFMGYSAFTVAKTPEILSYIKKGYMMGFAKYFYSKPQWEKMFKGEVLKFFEDKEDIGVYYLL